MRIELILNPKARDFGPLQSDIQAEVNALVSPKVRVSAERVPPPPGTLVVDEVFRLIIEHKEEIKAGAEALVFLKALLEVARAVATRRRAAAPPRAEAKEPAVIVVVNGDKQLELPSSADKEKAFLKALVNPTTPKAKRPKRKRKKK